MEKNRKTRFGLVLMNWEIVLLTKTSTSVYDDIVKVMKFLSSSEVIRKTKDLVRKQGIVDDLEINFFIIQTMKEKLIGSDSNIINGSLSFDNMYIKQGIII